MELISYLMPFTKINSKLINDLSIRPEAIKLLEENIRKILLGTILSTFFFDMTPKHKQKKQKQISKLHKTVEFLHSKSNN